MSDENTATEFAEPSAEAWQALAEAADAAIAEDQQAEDGAENTDTPEDSPDDTVGNEAARYRKRLRAAEAEHEKAIGELTTERDQLAEQLTAIRRNQIDNHTVELGIKPEALWASGAKVEDLLGDDGVPDVAKITAAVNTARTTLGILHPSHPQLGSRSGSGASATGEHRQASWAAALNSPRREE